MKWQEVTDALVSLGVVSALGAFMLRPRFYLSLDGGTCRQVVDSGAGSALYIRVKVERLGINLKHETCSVLLRRIWHNDKLVEDESSSLQ
jgi:hypothetical protein